MSCPGLSSIESLSFMLHIKEVCKKYYRYMVFCQDNVVLVDMIEVPKRKPCQPFLLFLVATPHTVENVR